MKTEKWMQMAFAAVLLTAATSCEEWGKQDPPAGNQVNPTLENVAVYDFEAEEGLDPSAFRLSANPGGTAPEIIEDETKGNVLRLNNGYVTLSNPLNKVTVQNAVSFTFWMKQPLVMTTDEEGNEVAAPQDLSGTLLGFSNATGNGSLTLNANGGITYTAADGEWIENDPASVTTGYLTPGDWHYVAVILNNDGYEWWVDGDRKVAKNVAEFDCSKLVQFANNVPVLTIGGEDNTSEWLVDDLKVYRNTLTSKETARPNLGGGGSGDEGPDLTNWLLVGLEDNTTGFWSTWSDYYNLTGDGTIHYEFYNYNGGHTNNWENWALVLTNGPERGGDGYLEYLYLRADAFGWGTGWGDNAISPIESNFNWDTFMAEMDGAYVTVDITRKGNEVKVRSSYTTESGEERYQQLTIPVDSEVLGSFLTCESSHLLVNPDALFIGETYNAGQYVTGVEDCSTVWWTAWSPLNKFTGNFTNWGVEFINHTTGTGANWNNWLLVCTNGTWIGEEGYAENFVLRSDAFGWGASFDALNTSMEHNFDWDNYVADMKDARVQVLFSYSGGNLTMLCHQWTADGRQLPDYRFTCSSLTSPIGLFFTCELAYLEFTKIGYFPAASMQ
jgi:hypothetical protein